jgi:single-stranded DNA-specific DHH superfamily exonuclease
MAHIDIFNGDADGICALTQLRSADPLESRLITGVKRDIALVAKAEVAAGDQITALDISFDKNREGVLKALKAGAEIFYVDHHFAGEIPESDKLTTIIDTDPNVCTSLLVNGYLKGTHVEWAVTGAFGDNLKASARTIAAPLGLSEEQLTLLENLGVYMNYNGYGSSLEDLHFAPAELLTRHGLGYRSEADARIPQDRGLHPAQRDVGTPGLRRLQQRPRQCLPGPSPFRAHGTP